MRGLKALAFDVFGTVVDWRGSIIREATAFGAEHGIDADWSRFADAWRAGYKPAMQRVRSGELPWQKIDALHRLILDDLLVEFDLTGLAESDIDHLNRVWHRLDPWPDAVPGLSRLKTRYVVTTLSNGNFSLLTNIAKRAGLPWDCIVSAELFRHYKPDPETYLGTADLLGIPPAELMLVACHPDDLRAARAVGCRTGYVAAAAGAGAGSRAAAGRGRRVRCRRGRFPRTGGPVGSIGPRRRRNACWHSEAGNRPKTRAVRGHAFAGARIHSRSPSRSAASTSASIIQRTTASVSRSFAPQMSFKTIIGSIP